MQHSEFIAKLKKINPRIVFRPGRNISSGLYLVNNGPDAHEIGLLHLCGIPSPRLFFSMPKFNWVDEKGVWHRGWKVVLRILVEKGIISRYDVMKRFGSSVFSGGNGMEMKFERKRSAQEIFDHDVMAHLTLADRRKIYSSAVA